MIKQAKRIVLIVVAAIVVFAAAVGVRQIYMSNFSYNGMVFTGYGFHTSEPVQKMTDTDLIEVKQVLDTNHISYKVNNDNTALFVRVYKWDDAANALDNCGYEFDGCVIT